MRTFFTSICLTLIAYGSVNLIKNSGKTAKMSRFIFALCVLCSFVSLIPAMELELHEFNSSAQYENRELNLKVSEQVIVNLLESESITFSEVTVSFNDSGDAIEEIRVTGSSDKEKTIRVIKSNTEAKRIEVS